MAKKTLLVCDSCGLEVDPQTGGWMRANAYDNRRSSIVADLCVDCMKKLPGRPVARRGRPAKGGITTKKYDDTLISAEQ